MSSQPPLPIKFITQNDPRGARRISPPNLVFTQPKTAHPGGPLQWHLVWQEELPGGRFFDWPTSTDEAAKHAGLQGLFRLALLRGGDMMKILGESETPPFDITDDCKNTVAYLQTIIPLKAE